MSNKEFIEVIRLESDGDKNMGEYNNDQRKGRVSHRPIIELYQIKNDWKSISDKEAVKKEEK